MEIQSPTLCTHPPRKGEGEKGASGGLTKSTVTIDLKCHHGQKHVTTHQTNPLKPEQTNYKEIQKEITQPLKDQNNIPSPG
jgi:hypothetical protein